ncbi:MAG TPA: hypothetical protein VLA45_06440, partial [Paracoccaceae bacterium]|nr:hypothetical protein [Paracoccaceae bacterium]
GLIGDIPLIGATYSNDDASHDGMLKVTDVVPNGSMADAGVRPGDMVQPERSYFRLLRPSIGDRLNFTLYRGGEGSQFQVTVQAAPQTEESSQRNTMIAVNALALLVSMLIGCFNGGAANALYVRTAQGDYARIAGDLPGNPVRVDADDPVLATMRAERGQVIPAEVGSTLVAHHAFPMLNQATLAGFVVLGGKPTGEDYRPDEIELLEWASHQVGLDGQAIRARELEQLVVTLGARNSELAGALDRAVAKA